MPELQKLRGGVVMPPSSEEIVASPLSQALGSEKSDVVNAAVDRHVVFFW
jgi:hypothetical protein